jgi:uncharacterized membrane protein YfcA
MHDKLFGSLWIWGGVIATYIIMAAAMPAINGIITSASAGLAASADMTQFPGTQEAVDSAPAWIWIIPGLVGIVAQCVHLVRNRE